MRYLRLDDGVLLMLVGAPYQGWAILELMGHRQRVGFVNEVEMFGTKMLRIDVPVPDPKPGEDWAVSEFYGGGSVYALSPCTEEVARDLAKRYGDPRPVRPRAYAVLARTDNNGDPVGAADLAEGGPQLANERSHLGGGSDGIAGYFAEPGEID